MPKTDGFLGRWSRRKAAARVSPGLGVVEAGVAEPGVVEPGAIEPGVAAPELPPIETLDISSDYTAFLQQGVSAVVQQQALRRAWESDASIAGFRGMADYDWDFNAPSYGRLWATDDVLKLVQDVLASPPADEPVDPGPVIHEPSIPEAFDALAAAPAIPPAAEAAPSLEPAAQPRRHGSALPC